jgi:hypothetical protein
VCLSRGDPRRGGPLPTSLFNTALVSGWRVSGLPCVAQVVVVLLLRVLLLWLLLLLPLTLLVAVVLKTGSVQ